MFIPFWSFDCIACRRSHRRHEKKEKILLSAQGLAALSVALVSSGFICVPPVAARRAYFIPDSCLIPTGAASVSSFAAAG
jgi:hypothetical protein